VNYGHFELNEKQIAIALEKYNSLSPKKKIERIEDAVADYENITEFERRLTKRVMTRKIIPTENVVRKILLCRHGETNWNVEGRIKGQIDGLETVFTDNGMNQINSVAQFISEHNAEAIFTSDLFRTVETSKLINEKLELPLYFCDKFRGLNMGIYQGGLMSDFLKDEKVSRCFIDYDIPIPGGESINQLLNRFMRGLDLVCETGCYMNAAVISHGAAISNIKSYLSGEKYEDVDYCVLECSNGKYKVISSGKYREKFSAAKD
jgi:probable phosphoglycerate mutase